MVNERYIFGRYNFSAYVGSRRFQSRHASRSMYGFKVSVNLSMLVDHIDIPACRNFAESELNSLILDQIFAHFDCLRALFCIWLSDIGETSHWICRFEQSVSFSYFWWAMSEKKRHSAFSLMNCSVCVLGEHAARLIREDIDDWSLFRQRANS